MTYEINILWCHFIPYDTAVLVSLVSNTLTKCFVACKKSTGVNCEATALSSGHSRYSSDTHNNAAEKTNTTQPLQSNLECLQSLKDFFLCNIHLEKQLILQTEINKLKISLFAEVKTT